MLRYQLFVTGLAMILGHFVNWQNRRMQMNLKNSLLELVYVFNTLGKRSWNHAVSSCSRVQKIRIISKRL
jgi:hypothetical protein